MEIQATKAILSRSDWRLGGIWGLSRHHFIDIGGADNCRLVKTIALDATANPVKWRFSVESKATICMRTKGPAKLHTLAE